MYFSYKNNETSIFPLVESILLSILEIRSFPSYSSAGYGEGQDKGVVCSASEGTFCKIMIESSPI